MVHAYPDDFATVALALMLKRPVKFVADRIESFSSDIHAREHRIRARIVWEPSNANVFVTKPGPFTDLAVAAIEEVTGRRPELSTSGGTSDARFISSYCPVIEFGLVGQTMHQIDERTPLCDLEKLTRV